ncbi:ankyrin repeats (3 copies) domain-containing protein [Rhizoctonia solani AG-1 IA]|uniref:Ankyrin repeats (3 copies) domain-containing protein n=1 Tax=Thanatephorus cucumeris (strain AG1-IA) TaxID=983506 RepID=L8X8T1_THACA|nr:ankyrin repeats (3 copies) domain-containing protein [Rhizoctonia solani AG-1 IA]
MTILSLSADPSVVIFSTSMSNALGDPLSTIDEGSSVSPSPGPESTPVPEISIQPDEDDDDEEFVYPGEPEPAIEPAPVPKVTPQPPVDDPLSAQSEAAPLTLAIPAPAESQPSPQPTSAQLDAIYNAAAAGSLLEMQSLFADTRVPAFALANDAAPRTGLTALHAAASRGKVAVVRWLIEECGTSLHKAALNGHLSVVTYLLGPEAKADVHAQDADGWTALHNACSKGYLDIVRYLCESAGAADQLESPDQRTIRVNAASKGHLPVVLYLLTKQAADPMIRNNWGETAYDIAAAVFEVWICEVLQKAEADRWQGSQTTYNPLADLFVVSVSEQQRLDVRLKTLARSGGRPKFSASGLGKRGRRNAFELSIPVGLQVAPNPSALADNRTPPPTPGGSTGGIRSRSGSIASASGTSPGYVAAWRSDVVLPTLEQPFTLPAPVPSQGRAREGVERSHFWLSDWTLDLTHPRANASEGWQYAQSFDESDDKWTSDPPSGLEKLLQGQSGLSGPALGGPATKWVRRRRWVRVMRRRLDIPPLPFMEPSGMYWVGADGGLVPVGEEGGEEMGAISGGGDYVTRARYLVALLESPGPHMDALEYGRRVAKLERAVNDLKAGLIGDEDQDRKKQAETLVSEYSRELEKTRSAAASAGYTLSADDTQDVPDDDSSDESFHYPGSPTSTARAPSIITQPNDYFTQSRRPSAAAPHDLTPQLSQAPEFRVPTHEAPQKVLTPHWTPPTPHSIQTRWEPDDTVSECRHCRRCGQIFCDRCSSRRAVLDPSDVVLEPSVAEHQSNYPGSSSTHRVCESCYDATIASVGIPRSLRTPERIVVDTQSLLVPRRMRSQESSQISDLADCPVCNQNLSDLGSAAVQEDHVRMCLEGGRSGPASQTAARYLVYKLPAESALIDCLASWLQRGRSCPVHARDQVLSARKNAPEPKISYEEKKIYTKNKKKVLGRRRGPSI